MPYLHRRHRGYVDLLVDKEKWIEIVIKDSLYGDGAGLYGVTINGITAYAEDTNANVDTSTAIATALKEAIEDSSLDVTVSSEGNVVLVKPNASFMPLSVSTFTNDIGGGIFYRDATPEDYLIKVAPNWDQEFVDLVHMIRSQGRSPSIANILVGEGNPSSFRNKARYIFNPSDFDLVDDDILFIKIAPIFKGVEQEEGRLYLLLPTHIIQEDQASIALTGEAPVGDITAAQEFHFPFKVTSFRVQNLGEEDYVYLSFDDNLYQEIPIATGEAYVRDRMGFSTLRIRTASTASDPNEVSIHVTLNNNLFT